MDIAADPKGDRLAEGGEIDSKGLVEGIRTVLILIGDGDLARLAGLKGLLGPGSVRTAAGRDDFIDRKRLLASILDVERTRLGPVALGKIAEIVQHLVELHALPDADRLVALRDRDLRHDGVGGDIAILVENLILGRLPDNKRRIRRNLQRIRPHARILGPLMPHVEARPRQHRQRYDPYSSHNVQI